MRNRSLVMVGWLLTGGLLTAGCNGAAATPSPSMSTSPTLAGSPTPVPVAMASLTFDGMMLDAAGGQTSEPRTFSFLSDGEGVVTASVKSNVTTDMTELCVTVGMSAHNCKTANSPTLALQAVGEHDTWKVEVISADLETPTVSVTLSWPTQSPALTMTHGRLQGSSPDVPDALNGFNVSFAPRGAGFVTLEASWTIITTDIDISLDDTTKDPSKNVDVKQLKGVKKIDPPYTYGVVGSKKYRLSLRNVDADSKRPDLTAAISFP